MQVTNINFGNAPSIDLLWSDLCDLAERKRAPLLFVEDGDVYTVFFVEGGIIYRAVLYKDAAADDARFPEGYDRDANDTDRAEFEATYKSKTNRALTSRTAQGVQRMESVLRTGSKAQLISQNFCDKRTWYSTSIRRTAQSMTDTGDGLTFALDADKVGVDVKHARILHERRLRPAYAPKVYADGVQKTEKDPHNDVGDFVIDYLTMQVTFAGSQSGKAVTITFSEVANSKWYLKPTAGKVLRLVSAELQFSDDAKMKDTFVFQARGDVAKFPALAPYWNANGGPYPAGTMLPLGDATYYQSKFDLICEANLAYPLIGKTVGGGFGWRDMPQDMNVYSWDYGEQATIDISSAVGMDIEVCLEHDTVCEGLAAVVTFYCISEDET